MSPPSKHSLFLQRSETEGVCKISTCRIRTATEIDHLLHCVTGGSAVRSYRSASETSGTLRSDPYVLPLHFSTHILVSILLPPLLHTVSFFKTPKFFDISLKQPIVNYKITQIALDHENPLEISFLAFYFLPHFFHGIEVDAGHFQASGGDNTLDLAETTLKLEVCFLQRHLGFDAQMTG